MRGSLLATASAAAFVFLPTAASAQAASQSQDDVDAETETVEEISPAAKAGEGNTIIVTATRREARLQDVPLSVSAFTQEELTANGIVGYERLARETPGVVLNRPTQNFNNFTARGISTNGYSAGLQAPVAIYIDELPISANGNSTILDPNLYDVERVEFLRGPQGTLFGSGSLAGAMRLITKAPNPKRPRWSTWATPKWAGCGSATTAWSMCPSRKIPSHFARSVITATKMAGSTISAPGSTMPTRSKLTASVLRC